MTADTETRLTFWQSIQIFLPVAALAVLAIIYSVWWFYVADEIERAITEAHEQPGPNGETLDYSKLNISGFPFRVEVTLDNLRAATGETSYSAEQLIANILPYRFDHIVFRANGQQRLTALRAVDSDSGKAPTPITIEGKGASTLASALFEDGLPTRFDLDIQGFTGTVTLEGEEPRAVTASRAQAHLRRNPDRPTEALDVVTSAEDLAWQGGDEPLLGRRIEEARLTGTWEPPLGLDRLDGVGPDALGTLAVENALLRWGEVEVAGGGTVALDAARRPQGEVKAFVGGYDKLLDALVASGQLGESDAQIAGQILTMMALAGRDPKGRVPVALTMRDGGAYLGKRRIAGLGRLF